MIKYLEQADEVVTVAGKKIHLFDVPKATVKEVLIGQKGTTDVADRLRTHLSKTAPHGVVKRVSFTPKGGLSPSPCSGASFCRPLWVEPVDGASQASQTAVDTLAGKIAR